MTALTVYLTSTNDTVTLTTARTLVSTAPSSVTTVSSGTFAKNGTGWTELFSQGGNNTLAGTEPAPSGHGFLFDVTTLEGQQIAAGTWTASILLGAVATGFTVTPVMRVFKYNGGTYTQFTNSGVAQDLTASSRSLTTSQVAATFSQALDAMTFGTGDKLYIDVLLDITTGSSSNTAANRVIKLSENGGASEEAVTPGYSPAPVAISGADTGHAAESSSLQATLSGADTAHGAESGTIRVSSADAAHGTDMVPGAAILDESGAGILDESGAAVTDESGAVQVISADTAHGADAVIRTAVLSADSGHAAEAASAGPFTWKDSAAIQNTAAVSTTSVTLAKAVAAGDLLVAITGSPNAASLTDSSGNTWVRATSANFVGLHYCLSAAAAAGGLTVTSADGGGSGTQALVVERFTPAAGTSAHFGAAANAAISGTSGTLGSLATVPAGELLWGGAHTDNGNITFTAGSSNGVAAISRTSLANASGSDFTQYVMVTAGGTESLSWTASGAVNDGGVQAAFSAVAAPSGPGTGTDTGHAADAGSVHAALTGADTAHAAESSAVKVPVSGADAGHAADSGSVHATVPGADSGHAAEGFTVRVSSADSGHAAEGSSVHAALSGSDTAHAAEGERILVSGSDTSHAAEASSVHAAVPGADTAHAAEGAQIRVAGSDTGHGAEAVPALHVTLPGADTGHGADSGVVGGQQPHSADAGQALESSSVHAALSSADSGHGADVPLDRWIAGSDTGHAAEAASVTGKPSSADSGHAAEASSLHAAVPGSDTGHAAESASVHAALGGADSGQELEAGSVHAALAGADSGHALEGSGVHASLSSADTASAVDTGSTGHTVHGTDAARATESAFYYIPGADSGSAAEGFTVHASSADTGHAAERALTAWPSAHDASGKAAEAALWSGPLASADSGHAAEKTLPFPFSSADHGTALEVLHEMGIWTYIPVNVRLEGRFWRITGTDEHGNQVVLLEAERLSRAELEYAEKVARGPVRLVSSADGGRARERSRPPAGVTCWVQPAVSVAVTVSAVRELAVTLWAAGSTPRASPARSPPGPRAARPYPRGPVSRRTT